MARLDPRSAGLLSCFQQRWYPIILIREVEDVTDEDDDDLPYGENFHDEGEAAAWADAAARKRPFRPQIFDLFAAAIAERGEHPVRVLELGSGPGFLAEHVLDRCGSIARYTLLDFARPMIQLSKERLARHAGRTAFVQADFKSEDWMASAGGPYDFVISNQAIHELRHKRHAPRLYRQARALVSHGGELVVCDHLPESGPTPRHRRLYMSIEENLAALVGAGFASAQLVWSEHHMAMFRARA